MKSRPLVIALSGLALLTFLGCGGGNATVSSPAPTPTLKSIAVTPTNSLIFVPANVQFIAIATFSDGSTRNLTTVATWNSSALNVASVTNEGLAVGAGVGNTTITATSGVVSGSATLAVGGSTRITATLGKVSGSTSLTVTPPAAPAPPSRP